jgi:hypothetical protein
MALEMAIVYKGIPLPDAYYKITDVNYNDSGSRNEVGEKLYNVYYTVNSYTNPTKEYGMDQVVYNNLQAIEADISIADGYTYLKTLPFFATAHDA